MTKRRCVGVSAVRKRVDREADLECARALKRLKLFEERENIPQLLHLDREGVEGDTEDTPVVLYHGRTARVVTILSMSFVTSIACERCGCVEVTMTTLLLWFVQPLGAWQPIGPKMRRTISHRLLSRSTWRWWMLFMALVSPERETALSVLLSWKKNLGVRYLTDVLCTGILPSLQLGGMSRRSRAARDAVSSRIFNFLLSQLRGCVVVHSFRMLTAR